MSNWIPKRLPLDRVQVLRAASLLHMKYTTKELADELGCEQAVITRQLIAMGCPHERDEKKHFLFIGSEVKEWIRAAAGGSRTGLGKMPAGMAQCFRCHRRVPMTPVEVVPWGHAELLKGTCNVCGARVNVARRRSEGANDEG